MQWVRGEQEATNKSVQESRVVMCERRTRKVRDALLAGETFRNLINFVRPFFVVSLAANVLVQPS